jgi:hypothetical protein
LAVIKVKDRNGKIYDIPALKGPKGDKGEKGDKGDTGITNTLSGKSIILIDVSPLEHDLKIKLTSDTITDFSTVKVNRYGKNLATAQQTYKGATRYAESVFEGKNCIRYNSGATVKNKPINFKENQQYTISFKYQTRIRLDANSSHECLIAVFYTDGTKTIKLASYEDSTEWKECVLTTTAGKTVESIGVDVYNYCSDIYIDVDTFQLEDGTSATPYEPCEVYTVTANADGTVEGLKSISPNMALIPDTDNVVIEVEYIADTKRYIDNKFIELKSELQALILEV